MAGARPPIRLGGHDVAVWKGGAFLIHLSDLGARVVDHLERAGGIGSYLSGGMAQSLRTSPPSASWLSGARPQPLDLGGEHVPIRGWDLRPSPRCRPLGMFGKWRLDWFDLSDGVSEPSVGSGGRSDWFVPLWDGVSESWVVPGLLFCLGPPPPSPPRLRGRLPGPLTAARARPVAFDLALEHLGPRVGCTYSIAPLNRTNAADSSSFSFPRSHPQHRRPWPAGPTALDPPSRPGASTALRCADRSAFSTRTNRQRGQNDWRGSSLAPPSTVTQSC